MKTLIVGGVAAGASTAARLRRLDESAETTLNGPERTAENRELEARSTPAAVHCPRSPDPTDAQE
jgi:NADPH-dependent 2,4-dienoyl-CoA reductase/sulfur reductase-like enzyme